MNKFTSVAIIVLVAVALTVGFFMIPKNEHVVATGDAMTKSDVEQIVRDFILNNPDVIVESLNSFQEQQRRDQQAKSAAGAKQVIDQLDSINAPIAGNPDGDVTVVEFFDYNCGFCKRALPTVLDLIKQDQNVKFVFLELPILSPSSEQVAKAATAVHLIDESKYLDYHTALMEFRGQKNEKLLLDKAEELGLNRDEVKEKMNSAEVNTVLSQVKQLASQAGVRGTPAFIIGEELIPGAVDINTLKAAVNRARNG